MCWRMGKCSQEEKGVFVSGVGVTFGPPGSTWARNPVPRVNTDNRGFAKLMDFRLIFNDIHNRAILSHSRATIGPYYPVIGEIRKIDKSEIPGNR